MFEVRNKSFTYVHTFGPAPAEARYKISGAKSVRLASFVGSKNTTAVSTINNEKHLVRMF